MISAFILALVCAFVVEAIRRAIAFARFNIKYKKMHLEKPPSADPNPPNVDTGRKYPEIKQIYNSYDNKYYKYKYNKNYYLK